MTYRGSTSTNNSSSTGLIDPLSSNSLGIGAGAGAGAGTGAGVGLGMGMGFGNNNGLYNTTTNNTPSTTTTTTTTATAANTLPNIITMNAAGQSHDDLLSSFDPLYVIALSRLKQASNTSALLAGFTMTALAQIAISPDLPDALVTAFALSMALLIIVHLFALMIATFVLPEISAFLSHKTRFQSNQQLNGNNATTTSNINNIASGNTSNRSFPVGSTSNSNSNNSNNRNKAEKDSIDVLKRFQRHITVAWLLSTALGIFLFIAALISILWIQFWNVPKAAIAGTVVVIPALAIFLALSCKLYRDVTAIQLAHHRQILREAAESVFAIP